MARVTGFTSERMLQIERETIVTARRENGNLILSTREGADINLGDFTGTAGSDAPTKYTWIKYADTPSSGMSNSPTNKKYIGIAYNKSTLTESTNYADYNWTVIEGQPGESAVVLKIDSTQGILFKNNNVATELNVTIFYGSEQITDLQDLKLHFGLGTYLEWSWRRTGDTNFGVISSGDTRISNGGFTLTVSPADVDVKVVFACTLNI